MASDIINALAVSRKDALDLASRMGQKETLAFLKAADAELTARLTRNIKGSGRFTNVQMQAALKQIRFVLGDVKRSMKSSVLSIGGKASEVATGNVVQYLDKANKRFTGLGASPLALREASMLARARAGTEASLLRKMTTEGKDSILARYDEQVIAAFEDRLSVGVATGKSWEDMRTSLIEASPFLRAQPASWADRIVRTEVMGAYNRATWEATKEANEQLGDLVRILAATFDDRTGWDSYQVHGQIRRSNEAFQWAGGLYQHPPNRPNDREIIVPHRISWPIPGYLKWKSDGEVAARYYQQRKSGSPGPRPLMTTVPLSEFGKPSSKDNSREQRLYLLRKLYML